MRLNERDIEVLNCILYAKTLTKKKLSMRSRTLIDWCRELHDSSVKALSQTTYRTLKNLNSLGILTIRLNDYELKNGKKLEKYSVNKQQLISVWKSSLEYSISKAVLMHDKDVPETVKKKIIEEFEKGVVILDFEHLW